MSEETTVNFKGTFAKKTRQNNGLNRVADFMIENRLTRMPVVGYVEFLEHTETTEGDKLKVDWGAVEPCLAADGTDVKGWGRQAFKTLDEIRVAHGKGRVADTLFAGGRDEDIDGQIEALTREDAGDEQAVNASGVPVDPPSKAELDAEKREAGEQGQLTDAGIKTPEQQSLESAVAANATKGGRTPRGPRRRPEPSADPFHPAGKDTV